MRITSEALRLLQSGNITQFEALPYQELLHELVLQELLAMFSTNDFINSAQTALVDCVTLRNMQDPCVVSNGRIYSRELILTMVARAGSSGRLTCPETRDELNKNFHQGQAYVMLPRIDSILQCAKILHAMNEVTATASATSSQQAAVGQEQHAKLELQASNGRVKIFFKFDANAINHVKLLSDYLELRLPKGRTPERGAFSLSAEGFSRAWALDGKELVLRFWYPTAQNNAGERRTFSEAHLNEVIRTFSTICQLPLQEEVADAGASYSLSNLAVNDYVVLMQDISVSSKQALLCLHRFLAYTARTANTLRFDVIDEVAVSGRPAKKATILGPGHFGSQHNILTSSQTQSYSFRK